MRLVLLVLLIYLSMGVTVEINNIHFGFYNVYRGKGNLKETQFHVKEYKIQKEQIAEQDTAFLNKGGESVWFDLNDLVRGYEIGQIDESYPKLMFRYFENPSIIVTVYSEGEEQEQIIFLNKVSTLGRDINDLQL